MSMQDLKNLFVEKVRKPLRKRHRLPKQSRSNKRLKLGEDEDDWCDALNHLSVDSDSDEEYFDALEKQVKSNSLPTEPTRKMAQAQKPSTNKKSEIYQYPAQSCTSSTSRVGSRTKYEGEIDQQQRQSFQGHSKSIGYPFDQKNLSAPITSTWTKTEPYFGSGRSSIATSSSSEANVHVGPKQSATIDDQLPLQIPMKDYRDKDGIPDSKLENLAKALMDQVYPNASSLGQKLEFSHAERTRYCGRVQLKYSSGILRMLRAWKENTPDAKQMPGLLEALKKANLKHLTDHLHSQEGKLEKRKVTVTLMTSWHLSSIEGLKKKLMTLQKDRHDLIEAVKVLQLPFSGLKRYAFTEDVDIMILCHSIVNRRLSITNVTDSLYDEFLNYCNKKLGKERIAVIAHDFEEEADEVRSVRMETFKHTQWSTFEKAGMVITCGTMDEIPEIQEKDWKRLMKFLEDATKSTPTNADRNQRMLLEKDTFSNREPSESGKGSRSLATSSSRTSMTSGMKTRCRKPVIYICTSWGLFSVKGLKDKLQNLLKQPFPTYEIREQELPYSRLEDYKFPSEVDSSDAMILCHSVQNRGFSITDVQNSIYDEFLKYCNRVFGRSRMAVIVHDFECKPEILKIQLETIHRTQPKTYQLADCVAVAGQLNVPDVQLFHDKSTSLEKFVRRLL